MRGISIVSNLGVNYMKYDTAVTWTNEPHPVPIRRRGWDVAELVFRGIDGTLKFQSESGKFTDYIPSPDDIEASDWEIGLKRNMRNEDI